MLTVPATDFEDIKVPALNLDKPKSHTCINNSMIRGGGGFFPQENRKEEDIFFFSFLFLGAVHAK